jgi:hypothetical protein
MVVRVQGQQEHVHTRPKRKRSFVDPFTYQSLGENGAKRKRRAHPPLEKVAAGHAAQKKLAMRAQRAAGQDECKKRETNETKKRPVNYGLPGSTLEAATMLGLNRSTALASPTHLPQFGTPVGFPDDHLPSWLSGPLFGQRGAGDSPNAR